jgi:hypothetical protein
MADSANAVRRGLRQRFRHAMRIVLLVQVMATSLPDSFESRKAERIVGQRNVELDVEISHLGSLADRIGWHEGNVGRQCPAAEHLYVVKVHGAR